MATFDRTFTASGVDLGNVGCNEAPPTLGRAPAYLADRDPVPGFWQTWLPDVFVWAARAVAVAFLIFGVFVAWHMSFVLFIAAVIGAIAAFLGAGVAGSAIAAGVLSLAGVGVATVIGLERVGASAWLLEVLPGMSKPDTVE